MKITTSRSFLLAGILLAIATGIPALYIPLKAQLARGLISSAWASTLTQNTIQRPWSWADTWPVAKLSVSQLEEEHYVLEGDNGRVLAFGPGHNAQSSLNPTSGNIIISGHRDGSFSWLGLLTVGHEIQLQLKSGVQRYKVINTQIVEAKDTRLLIDTPNPMLTLVTCYPLTGITSNATQRLVVSAVPVL